MPAVDESHLREIIIRHAITWDPQNKKKRCRPKYAWGWNQADIKGMNSDCKQMEKIAQDGVGWEILMEGLCSSTVGNRRKYVNK